MDKLSVIDGVKGSERESMVLVPESRIDEMMQGMRAMAAMIQSTNERLAAMEQELKRLTKITPSQYRELNEAIHKRAMEVCRMHKAEGCEKAAGNAIRKAMRATCGVNGARDLPRCDYPVALKQVQIWDDYRVMMEIKRAAR